MKLRKTIGCTLIIILTFCIFVNLFDTNLDLIENRITIDNSDKSEALPDIDLLEEINLTSCSSLEEKTGYAIVVGISDYPGSSNDLSYCDDDAQDVYSMLINDYNFEPSNIIYLQDSSATTSAMSSAFDTIAAQADSNDIFFFYFSGHGGRDWDTYQYSYVINSPHPYPNYYDNYWSIYSSGGLYMRVHFSRLETEYYYDSVYVGDYDIPYGWYYYEYTGYYPSGLWSGWVPGDRIYIRLISDYSITDYGFRIDYYQVDKYSNTEYLCSYNSIGTPSQSYFDYLLDSKLDAINCDEKFVICDACNSGGLIPEAGASGRYMMTACENDEYSLEDPSRQQGCFTYYLLRSLEYASDSNGDGVKSMEECYDYIYPQTVSRSGSLGYTHHPQEYDGISGECVLYPAIGSKSFNVTGNELNYTFEVFGTGAIQNMSLILANINDTDIIYGIEDLSLMATNVTGFCNYVNSSSLSGETNLDSYGLFVQVQGNKLLTLEHVNSNDYDNDSVYDVQELFYGLDPRSNDTDSDGLDDFIELNGDCDPLNNDTDGDGLLDGEEVYIYFTDPTNSDTDGDGLSDGLEIILGSRPNDSDSDNDYLTDGLEYWTFHTSLLFPDSDFDGLLDGIEVYLYHTYPLLSDTDGDGTPDGLEVSLELDPLNSILSVNIIIILNSLGIVLFALVGSISFLEVRKKRKVEIRNKRTKVTFKIKGTPDIYNGLLVHKKTIYIPPTTKLFPERKNYIETEYRKLVEKPLKRKCQYCGVGTYLPFTCSSCGKSYCMNHRLPEFHQCEKSVRVNNQVVKSQPTVACIICGTINLASKKFCRGCGSIIVKIKVCRYCGKRNLDLRFFCTNCGRFLV